MKTALLATSILLAAAVAGCGTVSWAAYAELPPPRPYVEVAPPAPATDYAWINGYWWWDGSDYVWMRGYWAPRPMSGYVWVGTGWTYDGGRYRFLPGHWVASPGRVRERYVHPVPRVRVQTGTTYRVAPNVPSVRVPVRPR